MDSESRLKIIIIIYPLFLIDEQDCILEPLCFPEQQSAGGPRSCLDDDCPVGCVLCSHSTFLSHKDQLLKHLLLEHKLVIADIKLIADFPK